MTERVLPPPWPGEPVELGLPRCAEPVQVFVRHASPEADGVAPAVFVHGLGGSARNWTDLIDRLRGDLDCYAPDLPGFGESPQPPASLPNRYGVTTSARVLAALVQRLDRGPVHLVANSLGGAVAVVLAARRPDLVRTLTLIDAALPQYRVGGATWHMPVIAVPGLGSALARRFVTEDAERRVAGLVGVCFADPAAVPAQRLAEEVEEMRRRQALGYDLDVTLAALRGLLRAYLVPGRRGLWREAARIGVPTLVVHGLADRIVPARVGRRLAQTVPGAQLLLLPQTGHLAMLERPELVAGALRGFMTKPTSGA